MSNERLGTITPVVWKAVLHRGHELDLNKGGLWDARSGAVNLWCSREDAPEGWPPECEITEGALNYPREFVASISPTFDEGLDWNDRVTHYAVDADITMYRLKDWAKENKTWTANLSTITSEPGVGLSPTAMRNQFLAGRCIGDLAWVRKHWDALLADALATVPPPLQLELGPEHGGRCLKCGNPLHSIARVISSPWPDGLGDWDHFCPVCNMLTQTEAQVRASMAQPLEPGSIGRVFGVNADNGSFEMWAQSEERNN